VADYASQHIIVSAIQNVFPSDAIIAEEDFTILSVEQQSQLANYVSGDLSQYPKATSESHRFWTIDPIDGTKGFIRNGQYAVCVALVEERQVILSLLNCPRLPNHNGTIGTLFVAMKGFGCFEIDTNGHHRHLNAHRARSEVEGAILAESYEANHSDHDLSRKMTTILKLNPEPIRMDSQCKYGLVARGDAHVYIRCPKKGYSERIWV
jgi:3'(2'), 5'-bisphosphate nucleotidase